jgi:hypothetical protein
LNVLNAENADFQAVNGLNEARKGRVESLVVDEGGVAEDVVNGCAAEEIIRNSFHIFTDEGALVMAPSAGEVLV